jgi:hypothetical protein
MQHEETNAQNILNYERQHSVHSVLQEQKFPHLPYLHYICRPAIEFMKVLIINVLHDRHFQKHRPMIKTRVSFVSFVFTSQVYILADISTLFYERGRGAVASNKGGRYDRPF